MVDPSVGPRVPSAPEPAVLAACPPRPNCVASGDARDAQRVEALRFAGSGVNALAGVRAVLEAMPRIAIVAATPRYLHAEARSRILGFVDDIEFLLDEAEERIEVRSAARVGYSDLGVNRRRVETIRARLRALPEFR